MHANYYPLALFQEILFQHNMRQIHKINQEIQELKTIIFAQHKKHRRCDKDLEKLFHCEHCNKIYASDVALKLHIKLKHRPDPKQQKKQQINGSSCQHDATPQSI